MALLNLLRELRGKMKEFWAKIRQKIRLLNKQRKAARWFRRQNGVAKILDGYIDDFLSGKIERFSAVPKKPELVGQKIIWQYWHQGINEHTPKIVINCLNSTKKYSNGYKIILLTRENMNDYIGLPDFVWEKLGTGRFDLTKLSNLVRLYLLSAYGGVWADATIYFTGPIESAWLQKDFFALQHPPAPPPDADLFRKFDPLSFSWGPKVQAKMCNSFMIAKPNGKLVSDLLSILLEYWRKEKKTRHYFFFQICFNRMIQRDEWKNLNCEIVSDLDFHKLQAIAFEKFDQRVLDEISAKTGMHKLVHTFEKFGQIPLGSFADVLTRGENI
jgi:hypothetical protein